MVQDRTDPKTGPDRPEPDRTEALRSGPQSSCFLFSVFGPVRVWTGRTGSWTGPKSYGPFFCVFDLDSTSTDRCSLLFSCASLSLSTSALSEFLSSSALALDSSVFSSPSPICSHLSIPLLSVAALVFAVGTRQHLLFCFACDRPLR